MKLSIAFVSTATLSLLSLIAAPGCAGGSSRRTNEPTTLPSASRPASAPTRVRTEQSRKDPFEVDGGTERLGTLGGPLERRRLPSDQEPLDVPEVEPPTAGGEEEIPEDLERGGPDPDGESGPGTSGAPSTGGFIPIDIPPNAAPPGAGARKGGKASKAAGSSTKGTTSGAKSSSGAEREGAASEGDTRQDGRDESSRPTGGDDNT